MRTPSPRTARVLSGLGLVTLATLAAVGFAGDEGGDADSEAAALLPVEVIAIERRSEYPVRELHAGRVVSRRASDLGFERSGRLAELHFDQGDRVEAGALLARLDTRELRAQRRELVARQRQIDAELALAQATTTRRRQLFDADHLSPQQLDEAVYGERALEARWIAARSAVENVEVRLELSELRAPFAGTLSDRYADEGTVVSPGQVILRLLEDRALEVHVGVPPESATRLAVGSAHEVEIDGRTLPAVLAFLLPTIEPDTRTVRAVFHLTGAPANVRSGALARVALTSRVAAEGFWLPLTALAESRRGLWAVYAVVPQGEGFQLERRQVDVIHAEADRAFVRGTLREGERVVATGVHRLVPGQRVHPAAAA